MKIQILISKTSWANQYKNYIKIRLKKYTNIINFYDHHKNLKKGYDINIIFSYFKIIPKKKLAFSKTNLIPHESKLPRGKGMSPLTWQILQKKNKIYFSLIEADTKVDSGIIYFQKKIKIEKNLLFGQIKNIQLIENLKLIEKFIKYFKTKKEIPRGKIQAGRSTTYRRRTPNDSRININKTIKSQFNLLRVADDKNYPSFFKMNGKKYIIKISKI
ncbi:formyltransferase family protein [Candidatus Pelagibacter sp.]|jgi:methionyl-tRNA formyltransferase|nr:formyltransferase family protein [Candidatus Pelagibacter sp.]